MSAAGWSIVTVMIEREADVVSVRQRARRIAELLGFGTQDQTRIATAVSEIARNAVSYAGGGRAEFVLSGANLVQHLVIKILDRGPGIEDVSAVLEGRYYSKTGLGLGITGAQRLMDHVNIASSTDTGTQVTLAKLLPKGHEPVTKIALLELARQLSVEVAVDPIIELRLQNQELVRSFDALKAQQDDTQRLHDALDRTNKRVIALYAEIDQKATELEALNASL